MAGLYVHIPFCSKICHYCDFVKVSSRSPLRRERFLSALSLEVHHHAAVLRKKMFETLYFGGGTPSALSDAQLQGVFDLVRAGSSLAKDAEITLEANPEDISPGRAKLLRCLGVTRVSLGAQSFNDATLKRLNRAHGAGQIAGAFRNLRRAGFSNLNLDLMLSLPGETLADVRRSLQRALALKPEHVSLYELVVEPRTVFGKQSARGRFTETAETLQLEMLLLARETLRNAGLKQYELLNYARPGFESKHNLIYWANGEYLGLGPGAWSYLDGRRFKHSSSLEEYSRKIEAGDFSAAEEERLDPDRRRAESLLLALRLNEGADRALADRPAAAAGLIEKGLLEENGDRIRLTPRGQLFAETVFTELSH